MRKKAEKPIKTIEEAKLVLKAKPVCKCEATQEEKELLEIATRRADFESRVQDTRLSNYERELNAKTHIMLNARENVTLMVSLINAETGDPNLINRILNRSLQIIEETISPEKATENTMSINFEEDTTLTADKIRKAIREANVLDVIRNAKKNGWEVKISDNEVALFKDGKRIDGKPKDIFIKTEQTKTIAKI
jgi:hypothetical protein